MAEPSATSKPHRALPRFFTLEIVLAVVAVISGCMIVWSALVMRSILAQVISGIVFTLSLLGFIRLYMDPDSVRSRQTDGILKLSTQMLEGMQDGLTLESAQYNCQLLLPATAAIAVAITDREKIMGYAGYNAESNPQGANIRTTATHDTLQDGQPRVLLTAEEIGLPAELHSTRIHAAILMPLIVGHDIVGTLKFYYRKPRDITQTQRSIAEGFSKLLSAEIASVHLEEQKKLATSMELKALQAQINPHFLFNTINTISSFIRIDPPKARELLREFAVFYRSTLEDASDLIPLSREIDQTKRYFMFEVARFGEDRLQLDVDIDPEVNEMMVPSFMVQPLVENAVRHGRPSEGKMTITITGQYEGDNIVIGVTDDGVGMTEEVRDNLIDKKLDVESTTGLGIALKNIRDRMKSYFGPESYMDVKSELGCGTTISVVLKKEYAGGYIPKGSWGTDNSAIKPKG